MTRFQVGADEQDNFCVRVIRTGPIEAHPKLVTFAAAGGADVCVRVVTVNAPGGEYAFGESILAGPPDVIHDLVAAILDNCFTNPRGNIVKRFIPGRLFPFAFAATAGALEWVKNAIRILYLI